MVLLDFEAMCLCRLDKGIGVKNFRACMLSACKATLHKDVSGARTQKVRLFKEDPIGMLAICCPVSKPAVIKRIIFSCPIFGLSTLRESLLSLEYYNILLKYKDKPRVLKFLLEGGYPDKEAMQVHHAGVEAKQLPPPPHSLLGH